MKQNVYYYHDLINDDFANTNIKQIKLSDDYKYVDNNVFYKIGEALIRIIAFPLIFIILKIAYFIRIKNKKVMKSVKGGYFIYGNHTNYLLDAYNPSLISFFRLAHIVVNPDAVSIKGLGMIVKMLGAFPLPTSFRGFSNYKKSLNKLIEKKHVIAIYPEAHIWPYYTDIRPFGTQSFHYPVEANVASFAFTNIYVKRKIFKKPKVVTYIDGPFYPDMNLIKNDRIKKLRDDIYQAMKNRVDSNPKYEYAKYEYVEDIAKSNAKNYKKD